MQAERTKLREQLHEIEATAPDPLPHAYAYVNTGEPAPQSYVLRMGDPHNRLDPVEPAVPYVLRAGLQDSDGVAPAAARAFANWLASPRQSADRARDGEPHLAVPHGRGIVRTPNDFGTMGDKPDSHELLDWLAAEFMDARLEHQGDRPPDRHVEHIPAVLRARRREGARSIPQNRLFWRMNRKRLEGEAIRDAALAVAGTLNPELGGRPVRIPIEPEVYNLIFTESERDGLWPVNPDKHVQNRRGIYLYNKRSVRLPLLSAFDQPDAITSCPVRPVSTHALQSLSLFNSGFMQEVSHDSRRGSRSPAARIEPVRSTPRGVSRWRGRRVRGDAARARVLQDRRHAARFLPGDVQPKRVPLCSLSAHIPAGSHAARRPGPRRPRLRLARVGLASSRAARSASIRSPPSRRTSRRRPSPSSSCSWSAAPARWTRSIPSPRSKSTTASRCPRATARSSASSPRATRRSCAAPGSSRSTASADATSRRCSRTSRSCVDDLCFVRSFYTDSTVHAPAMYQVNTGRILMGYPSMGSWVTYGLGSESENLPGVRRHAAARGHARRRHAVLGRGLPPGRLPGHGVPPRPGADPQSQAARGHDAANASATRSTSCRR